MEIFLLHGQDQSHLMLWAQGTHQPFEQADRKQCRLQGRWHLELSRGACWEEVSTCGKLKMRLYSVKAGLASSTRTRYSDDLQSQ